MDSPCSFEQLHYREYRVLRGRQEAPNLSLELLVTQRETAFDEPQRWLAQFSQHLENAGGADLESRPVPLCEPFPLRGDQPLRERARGRGIRRYDRADQRVDR
jgi:hypothetical protein